MVALFAEKEGTDAPHVRQGLLRKYFINLYKIVRDKHSSLFCRSSNDKIKIDTVTGPGKKCCCKFAYSSSKSQHF
jgi:hypothetical protein